MQTTTSKFTFVRVSGSASDRRKARRVIFRSVVGACAYKPKGKKVFSGVKIPVAA